MTFRKLALKNTGDTQHTTQEKKGDPRVPDRLLDLMYWKNWKTDSFVFEAYRDFANVSDFPTFLNVPDRLRPFHELFWF